MSNFLRKIDYISVKPGLYSNQEPRFPTVIGGLMQVLIISLYIAGIIFFAKDIYLRENPIVVEYTTISNDLQEWDIGPTDFAFNFALKDPHTYQPYINESIYTLEILQNYVESGKIISSKTLDVAPCTSEDFPGVDLKIFPENFPWSDYYCINKSEKMKLSGSMTASKTQYIQLKVKPCNVSDPSKNCGTHEEMDDKLSGTGVALNYVDKYFEPMNFTDPTRYYLHQYNTIATYTMFRYNELFLKRVTFNDDIGFIYESLNNHTIIQVDALTCSMADLRKNPHFLELAIYFTSKTLNIGRRYKRFQEIIASVGGLFNFLNTIAQTLVSSVSTYLYFSYIHQKLFDESDSGFTPNDSLPKPNYTSTFKNIKMTDQFKLTKNEKNVKSHKIEKNQIFTKISKDALRSNAHLPTVKNLEKFSKFNIISGLSKNKPVIDRSNTINIVKSIMDYEFFIKKFKEIELLKHIFLENEHIVSFDKIVDSKSFANSLGDYLQKEIDPHMHSELNTNMDNNGIIGAIVNKRLIHLVELYT